jgi:hypothetical protein
MTSTRTLPTRLALMAASTVLLASAQAVAQSAAPMLDNPAAPHGDVPLRDDPTGGAYTSPTLLFIPAAAVPAWNVRAIVSTELQSPSDVHAGFRPGVGVGTNWVGGDINPTTNQTDFNLGISPYAQARFHILGDADGRGFQLGTSATYKFVGFEGDPGEIEWAVSAQLRERYWEAGLQAVLGKDFATTDADAEAHAYALVRPIPVLGLGAAGQLREGLVYQPGETTYDIVGGAIASLTLGRWQVAALVGASTIGLAQGQAGALGQLMLTARF